jgi:hydroxypyruvate isomerase
MMGDDPFEALRSFSSRIRHIQFADVPGRGEPGSGRTDLPRLIAAIDASGYDGWVGAEYRPTRATPETVRSFLE